MLIGTARKRRQHAAMSEFQQRRLRAIQQQLAQERFQGMVEGYKLGYAERSRQIREERRIVRKAKVKKGGLALIEGGKK